MSKERIVIVGAGLAAARAVEAARTTGFDGDIVLVADRTGAMAPLRRLNPPASEVPVTRYVLPVLALVALAATTLGIVPHVFSALVPVAHAEAPVREIAITVQGGYKPDRVEVAAGERVRLVFTRTEYSGCTREVVFPELGIRKELPTNQKVAIDLPDLAPGTYAFHCGMEMIHGTVVVAPAKG